MSASYDVALDLFAEAPINSTAKKFGTEFKLVVAGRNVLLESKGCVETKFDWPIEKIKEMKLCLGEYSKPSLYLCVAAEGYDMATFKLWFNGSDELPGECLNLIDEHIAEMGAFILSSPAWTPYLGAAPKVTVTVPKAATNGEVLEGEEAMEEVPVVPTMVPKLEYKVSLDTFSTVVDPEGLDKLGSKFRLFVLPREIIFKSTFGSISYKIEQIKAVTMLTAEYTEMGLLLTVSRDNTEVSHKLWVEGGEEAITECKNAILERIEAMCAHLSSSPAWYRIAPAKAVPVKKNRYSLR